MRVPPSLFSGERVIVSPSILSADFTRLAEAVELAEAGGADLLHIDVMDGRFVPNLTIGPPVIRALKRITDVPLDVHLMIEDPDRTVEWYLDAGADIVTVHVEASVHLHRTLGLITDAGAIAGVTLNPGTPIETLRDVLGWVGLVLVMSVSPGFGGQRFIPRSIDRIRRLSRMSAEVGAAPVIQVDGGIDIETAPKVVDAGARVLVAGNAVFADGDPAAAVARIRSAGEAGL